MPYCLTSRALNLLAQYLELLTQLENAIRIPSEIMLVAIRVQWWIDAVADMTVTHGSLR